MRVGDTELKGRILAVEKRLERKENAQVEAYRLSLLQDGGLVKNYDLSEISDIRFLHPRLQDELENYLRALFSRHRRDEKELVILASGQEGREIFVSYVREQPVWKVSYRIVMAKNEKPLLQAWAIVDNVSEEDWEEVSLFLVSGLPVSFVQNLYDPWYVKRPEVRLQREVVTGPVMHEAGGEMPEAQAKKAVPRVAELHKPEEKMAFAEAHAVAEADMPPPDMLARMAQQPTAAVARATGALFVYNIKQPVTVRRDRSALLPIASARVEATRLSIFNESTRPENPMDAVRLKNTTGLTLESGPVTAFEDNTYAGEALMDTLKPEEERYVSFAVDLGTRVNAKHDSTSENVYQVQIAHGTMTTYYKQRESKVYDLNNLEAKERTIVIEHPIREGWTLVNTPKPIEITPRYYRFETKLPAKGRAEFKVIEEMPSSTSYVITNLSRDQILYFVRQKYIDEKTRAFLEKVAGLQAEIAQLENSVGEYERQRTSSS